MQLLWNWLALVLFGLVFSALMVVLIAVASQFLLSLALNATRLWHQASEMQGF